MAVRRATLLVGAVLAIAGCGGRLDEIAGQATPESAASTSAASQTARVDDATFCQLMRGDRIVRDETVDIARQAVGGQPDVTADAQRDLAALNGSLDTAPQWAVPYLDDEAEVLGQIADGKRPDYDRYDTAKNAIERECSHRT